MNLAVMSDLHVGLDSRAKDLCPEPPATPKKFRKIYDSKIENAYGQQFVQFILREQITANYLVLPGDLTSKANPREVHIASDFILQAADALRVPHDKILFAPGNHDVDWTIFDPTDDTGIRWGQRYDTIKHPDFLFKRIVDHGIGDIFSQHHFIAWNFNDLLVVGYNSASHDSPVSEDAVHHGLVDPNHCAAIRQYLSDIGPPEGKIRLFLVHHHMLDFSQPMPSELDLSLMTNAENLLNLLHEFDFDLIIHGHKHHPRFETHSTLTYPHLPILCSGSFSVEIDSKWAGIINNQFHLVTINGREGAGNHIKGKVTSWSHNHCKGWIPSEESTSGIHHIIPFGSYVMPHELDAQLEPFISEWLTQHDHITWKQIIRVFPDLEHLPLNSAIEAFKRMEQRLHRKSMHQTLKDLMLY